MWRSGVLFLLLASLGGFVVSAAPLLPPPFVLPMSPSPGSSGCATCASQTKVGVEGATPHVDWAARAAMDIPLAPAGSLEQELLTVNVGADMAFYPSEKYQLLPPSDPRGDKDFLIVALGARKVGFKATVGELGDLAFQSYNHPGYTIKRDGEFLAVNDLNDDLRYLFGSSDGGYSWRLVAIRRALCPAMGISCEYDKKGMLSAVVLADGSKYELAYKDRLARGVRGPSGELALLDWDVASHIKSLRMYLTEKHPFFNAKGAKGKRDKELVGEYNITCDRAGQLLGVVNTGGERFGAEYFVDGADKKKGMKKFERVTLTKPDGSSVYGSNEWKTDNTKVAERGRVVRDKDGNVSYEPGETARMLHKASSLVCSELVRDGRKQTFVRGGSTLAVTAETDALGQSAKHEYDKQGLLTSTTYPDGSAVSYGRDPEGRLLSQTNEVGRKTTYKRAKDGALLEVDEAGIVTRYEYDKDNRPVKTILPGGFEHCFAWDELSRLVSHTQPGGTAIKYRYAAKLSVIAAIETVSGDSRESSSVFTYDYDPLGRLAKISLPDNTCEQYFHDCCNMLGHIDRFGAVTRYAYDQGHRKILVTAPDGGKTRFRYDARGQLVQTTNPDGLTERFAYDQDGNLLAKQQQDGSIIKCQYDALGRRLRETWPDGRHTDYAYDQRGRLLAVKGNNGKNEEYQYNLAGQLISSAKDGRTTTRDYDEHGRLLSQTTPGGSGQTFFYLPGTNLVQGTLADDVLTFHRFDKAGRKVSTSKIPWDKWEAAKTESEKCGLAERYQYETYAYDGFGNLIGGSSQENSIAKQ